MTFLKYWNKITALVGQGYDVLEEFDIVVVIHELFPIVNVNGTYAIQISIIDYITTNRIRMKNEYVE